MPETRYQISHARQTFPTGISLRHRLSIRAKKAFRWTLFTYLVFVLSPIGYLAPSCKSVDNSWCFALNYAAAHHLVMGRDVAWTWGPIFYLFFPFDIGNNLAQGFTFQALFWLVTIVILGDLLFRGGFRLSNLLFFSILIGLSAVDYRLIIDYSSNLPVCVALIPLVHFRLRGGTVRFVVSLVILGLIPLFQIFGTLLVIAAVAGLCVDLLLRRQRTHLALVLIIPVTVAIVSCRFALGSFHAIAQYVRWNLELSRGYSIAMSTSGPRLELVAAFEGIGLFVAALCLLKLTDCEQARFFGLVFVLPVLLSLKHGFARQDSGHVAIFFCFLALSLAFPMLAMPLNERLTLLGVAATVVSFAILWQDYVAREDIRRAVTSVTGMDSASQIWNACHFKRLRHLLDAEGRGNYPPNKRIEPEIRSVVGHEPVAFLSNVYSNALIDDLNLVLFPVLQRYAAFTPCLDKLNATWIADKGPRFLIFDGLAIDDRHPWTETPATWSEVYRWYNTRILGSRNLLLQRRARPRFRRFELFTSQTVHFGDDLPIPASPDPVFWTMQCPLSRTGKLRALLARVPALMMDVNGTDRPRSFRVLLPVLEAPSLAKYLPSTLGEFAEVFRDYGDPDFSLASLKFRSLGRSAYQPDCELEFLHALP